jgi:hypothetical protein
MKAAVQVYVYCSDGNFWFSLFFVNGIHFSVAAAMQASEIPLTESKKLR